METGRKIAWCLAVGSFLTMLGSVGGVAYRVSKFHEANKREINAFRAIDMRKVTFAGRPITLTDAGVGNEPRELVVRYGDDEKRLHVSIPRQYDLPGLKSHEDWMRLLAFAPMSGLELQEFTDQIDSGDLPIRLVIVTRTPRPGTDPRTRGSVWKKDWRFDFYEFKREGGIEQHPRLRYPTTRGVKKPRDGELQENTWQFQAALQLMPQAGRIGPTHNFFGNALSAASWTLPLATFSGLLCTVSLAFAFAPRRRGTSSWREANKKP